MNPLCSNVYACSDAVCEKEMDSKVQNTGSGQEKRLEIKTDNNNIRGQEASNHETICRE